MKCSKESMELLEAKLLLTPTEVYYIILSEYPTNEDLLKNQLFRWRKLGLKSVKVSKEYRYLSKEVVNFLNNSNLNDEA